MHIKPRRYKIGVLTSFDPMDKRKLSGITYFLVNILQTYVGDVELLGPIHRRRVLRGVYHRIATLFPKPYNLDHSIYLSLRYRWIFGSKLRGKDYDFIFAPRSSTEIALLDTKIPLVYLSDTTFKSLYGYYDWFSDFMKLSVWEGNFIERSALRKSSAVVMASSWAAESAKNDYGILPDKIFVIPFGPNMEPHQILPTHQVEAAINAKSREVCKLLFLGVEWYRKGGNIAFDALRTLRDKGVKVHLTVVGVVPPDTFRDADMTIIPYLNKNNPDEYEQFIRLFLEHHFLILPTRAECYGVVFAEASAFGLPSFTSDTGGVPSVVHNGVNGYRMPPETPGSAFAAVISRVFSNFDDEYLPLAFGARKFYEQELSAEVIGMRFRAVAEYVTRNNAKEDS